MRASPPCARAGQCSCRGRTRRGCASCAACSPRSPNRRARWSAASSTGCNPGHGQRGRLVARERRAGRARCVLAGTRRARAGAGAELRPPGRLAVARGRAGARPDHPRGLAMDRVAEPRAHRGRGRHSELGARRADARGRAPRLRRRPLAGGAGARGRLALAAPRRHRRRARGLAAPARHRAADRVPRVHGAVAGGNRRRAHRAAQEPRLGDRRAGALCRRLPDRTDRRGAQHRPLPAARRRRLFRSPLDVFAARTERPLRVPDAAPVAPAQCAPSRRRRADRARGERGPGDRAGAGHVSLRRRRRTGVRPRLRRHDALPDRARPVDALRQPARFRLAPGAARGGAVSRARPAAWVLFALMAFAAACGWALAPTERMADGRRGFALEDAIPRAFGDWRVNPLVAPVTVAPDVQAELDKIYDQILSRTYVNGRGDMVMLSIAYGGTQNRSMQVHRPEVCYPAQGFRVGDLEKTSLRAGAQELPVMRLIAQKGVRTEPITYWIRVGDRVVRGNIELGFARLAYGLGGRVPDGLLVRVSTISRDAGAAYAVQGDFVTALLGALPPDTRALLVGASS